MKYLEDYAGCGAVNTSYNCCIFAPNSVYFSAKVYDTWGAGGVAFLAIPPVMTVALLAIYAEAIYYMLLKRGSKDLISSLCWLLGTHPAILIIGTIAIFVPRGVVYLMLIYGSFFAFAMYKYYYLIITLAGGTESFVKKSSHQLVRMNQFPFFCLICLPKVYNTMKITQIAKWLIQQNIILTPFYGALGILLKSCWKFYGVSAFVILNALNAIATLMCMYGINLISVLAQNIKGMEEVHAISGKTRCMQLTMIVIGFEGVVFSTLDQCGVIPCESPFNFNTRSQVFYNYAVVLQAFFLGLMARVYFRRSKDIQKQAILHDEKILENDEEVVLTADDAYQRRSYDATAETDVKPKVLEKTEYHQHDTSSTSA